VVVVVGAVLPEPRPENDPVENGAGVVGVPNNPDGAAAVLLEDDPNSPVGPGVGAAVADDPNIPVGAALAAGFDPNNEVPPPPKLNPLVLLLLVVLFDHDGTPDPEEPPGFVEAKLNPVAGAGAAKLLAPKEKAILLTDRG